MSSRLYECVCVYACICVYTGALMYVFICTCLYRLTLHMYALMRMHVHVCTYVHPYYTYTYTMHTLEHAMLLSFVAPVMQQRSTRPSSYAAPSLQDGMVTGPCNGCIRVFTDRIQQGL